MTEHMSVGTMGVILGTSSIAGAVFDFLISKFFPSTNFRRVFLIMFAVALVYPLILWQATAMWMFLVAMALWGFYYDLHNFGNFDFVGRNVDPKEHSSSFGVISVFQSLGYMLAPILTGLVIGEVVNWEPFALAWIFLVIGLGFFLVLLRLTRTKQIKKTKEAPAQKINFLGELHLWQSVGKRIFPILILTMFLNIVDAFFWTIGPLYAESFTAFGDFEGVILTAYTLPSLLIGWFVGSFTAKLGKKHAGFLSFAVGSGFLTLLAIIENPFLIVATIFVASAAISMAWPAINGIYADYISESPRVEKEIEGVEDFFTNMGYVIGPMLAGFLAEAFGNSNSFALIGAVGIIAGLLLLVFTPKKLSLKGQRA
jgi:MFS family permease